MVAAVIFAFSVGFCIYTMFGYPLMLGVWAHLRRRPVRKAPLCVPVSIILPVHNGERWIGDKLESILALKYPPELLEILVVDDGSKDGTRRIVEQFARHSAVRLLALEQSGKAVALNTAIGEATGEILFFTDVR